MRRFVNMTPHPVNVYDNNDNVRVIEPCGTVPRLTPRSESLGTIGGLPIVRTRLGYPEGLPDPEDGVVLIVSALVAEHHSVEDREDIAYPGEAIRDGSGRVVGCRGLCAGPGLARRLRRESQGVEVIRTDGRAAVIRVAPEYAPDSPEEQAYPEDERFSVGNEIVVTPCGGVGRYGARFDDVCICEGGCGTARHYTIADVIVEEEGQP